ncbi:conserved hypothetical protein [Leishmania mexicana MHOM/GT/2001/U1103]|uniref:HpcH/HpaI aldolase/citrate lyase domain-containing protein n=1 Tax=Leishmania mexicana (strain MHOM/GT/2001/U1103) TaxID=929439 RepID=E9AWY9_LEIMU|nr:conserved hypothetical protein [Leishmania mexicana MHOM/GT/2001/U1103]CBZ27475.1 conserved hypothetical protein [Leishmania mexicana MHOM/GT/2001/U1103]
MKRLIAGMVGAPRGADLFGGAAAFLHTANLLDPVLRDSTAAATRAPRRSLSSSSSSSSSAFSGSPRCGSADASVVKGVLGRLRQLYLDFQIYRGRQLDAAAAVEQRRHGDSDDAAFSTAAAAAKAKKHGDQAGDAQARGRCSPLISRNAALCPRSVLFVPGSKPRALAKIPTLPADCFILDLEDSVGVASKRRARENIQAFVDDLQKEQRTQRGAQATTGTAGGGEAAAEAGDAYPRLIVRINSPDYDPVTAMLDLQLVGLLGPAIEGIALPKTTVRTHQLIKDYVYPSHQLWAFFESPLSVMQAPLICGQQVYRYAVMGYNDLSAELQLPMATPPTLPGATDGDPVSEDVKGSLHIAARLPLWQSTVQVLLAARAHHMFVIDAVFNDPTDKAGFRRSLQECRLLGLDGKTLIHPGQIEPTNAAYTPAEAEVAWAQRIVEAVERSGGDVTTVDGAMAEDLHQRQARHVLALHRSAELEKTLRKSEAPQGTAGIGVSKEAAEGTTVTGVAGGDSNETGRQPRRTPSRHRYVS